MSIKKFLVAGLAVVGIVGMVSAVGPLDSKNEVSGAPKTTGSMEVAYEVQLTAEMTVLPKPLNNLFVDPSSQGLPGNLGSINVTTNYPFWDITVSAANGLKLKQNDGTPVEPPFGGVAAPTTGPVLLAAGTDGKYDCPGGTAPCDTVALQVYVGILNGNAFAFTSVDFTDSLVQGGVFSFADVIGESGNVPTAGYNGQVGTAIKGNGFATPSSADGVTFYVNAGLGENVKISKSKNGIYKETLTFTLVAGF
jgi:hypothetical protein